MHITNQKPVVLVTGSSRGIGRAIALQFAKNHYHVILNCSTSLEQLENVKKEILALPDGSCTCCLCDVSDSSQVTAMFEEISATCGQIDVLINNAGISHIGLFTDMTDDLWNRMIQTNLSSVFYCSRATLPSMISRKKGKIINISSMWGTVGASCEVAYSAAKSGIHGLTRALAKELAPSNIQVNTIACGAIYTAMNAQLSPEERLALEEDIPACRFGTPEEVASLAWDLAHAPAYMTGQIIGIDGGYI